MKAIPVILATLALAACGTTVQTKPGGEVKITGGFLSSIAGLLVKVTSPDGTKVQISQTGYDGTTVANTLTTTAGTAYGVGAVAGVQKVQARQPTAQAANARGPTITPAQQTAPGTTVYPKITQPPKAIIP